MTITRSLQSPAPLTTGAQEDHAAAASRHSGRRAGGSPDGTVAAERCAWSLVWLSVIVAGVDLWGGWSGWTPSAIVAPAVAAVGIVGVSATWLVGTPRSRWFQRSTVAAVVVSTFGSQGVAIHARRYYATDSAAFNQVAARLLAHGVDPYTATMGGATGLLQNAANFWTYTINGGYVDHVSYPAGSFLLEMPAVLLGFRHEVVDWVDLCAWLVTGVLVFALLPVSIRWVGALLLVTPVFADIFAGGGTDAGFLPFLVLAVWRWDRYGLGRQAGIARWAGPIALGVACSIKQTPWFCIPFLVAGVYLEASRSGRRPVRLAVRYLLTVVVTFAAVNLPFIVWQPAAWAKGSLLPITQPLVVDGQGLVTVALHGISRGVSIPLLSLAGLLVLVGLWGAFAVWYPVMKRIWLLVLPLAFFVAPRSLSTYLLDLFPAAIVAAVTVGPAAARAVTRGAGRRTLPSGAAVLGVGVAATVVAVLAFTSPPLQLEVRSVMASPGATLVTSVTVGIHNQTDGTVRPHFMVNVGSPHPNDFWHARDGRPVELAPHASMVVTLYPAGYTAAPPQGSRWLVEAYTAAPEALSTSPLQIWRFDTPG
ncbi:MAG: hypothetical protein ACLQPH_11600 [Acidimicrobiales bacterium]